MHPDRVQTQGKSASMYKAACSNKHFPQGPEMSDTIVTWNHAGDLALTGLYGGLALTGLFQAQTEKCATWFERKGLILVWRKQKVRGELSSILYRSSWAHRTLSVKQKGHTLPTCEFGLIQIEQEGEREGERERELVDSPWAVRFILYPLSHTNEGGKSHLSPLESNSTAKFRKNAAGHACVLTPWQRDVHIQLLC